MGSSCGGGDASAATSAEDSDEGELWDIRAPSLTEACPGCDPWLDDDMDVLDEEELPACTPGKAPAGKLPGELWFTQEVYPSGGSSLLCEDNIKAAQQYVCPCGNSCLSKVGFIPIYELRKTEMKAGKGKLQRLYDAAQPRYSTGTKMFAGFTLGSRNDCCFAAYALASVVSNSTAVRAGAHVSKGRTPTKPKEVVDELKTEAACHLHAHIRDVCKPLENAPTVRDKKHEHEWSCSREAVKTRWQTYVQL